jgi:hypothetical protein
VHELHDLNVLQLLLSHDSHDMLLSNSHVLRSHSVLCSKDNSNDSLGDARLEASLEASASGR